MPMDATYHRARRQRPEVARQRRVYKRAYERALARLRDENRGRFGALLVDELAHAEEAVGS